LSNKTPTPPALSSSAAGHEIAHTIGVAANIVASIQLRSNRNSIFWPFLNQSSKLSRAKTNGTAYAVSILVFQSDENSGSLKR